MPISVKILLADLIEMYRIWGEIIYLFKQKDLQPVYIIQFDELFENRIAVPLQEAETLRKRLPEHFKQIKYENINFNIQFETDIYKVTADLSEMFVNTFKFEPRIAFFRNYLDFINTLHKLMRNFHNGLLTWIAFFGEVESTNYEKTFNLIHTKLKTPIDKELPAFALQMISRLIPGGLEIQTEHILKFMYNKAVVIIMIRLFSQEPWKTISNYNGYHKVFGSITGPEDERFRKIFNSPAAIQSLNALRLTKEQEKSLILDNRELIYGLSWLLKNHQGTLYFRQIRTLFNIIQGRQPFIDVLTIVAERSNINTK